MAFAPKPFNEAAANKRLSHFVDNLTIDEVRVLARLLSNWQKRDQRRHPRTPCSLIPETGRPCVALQAKKGTLKPLDFNPER